MSIPAVLKIVMYYLKPIELRGKTLLMEVKFKESWGLTIGLLVIEVNYSELRHIGVNFDLDSFSQGTGKSLS